MPALRTSPRTVGLLEAIGPELRPYLVAGNNGERPFTRDQRRWVYASAKKENNYFGFGTDNDIEYTAGNPVIKHRTFGRSVPPSTPEAGHEVDLPSAKTLGGARGQRLAFQPNSVVNISAMSFGSLSGQAIEALNRGTALAGCMHTAATTLREVYEYQPGWGLPSAADRAGLIHGCRSCSPAPTGRRPTCRSPVTRPWSMRS